jgi:hypothetical protein
LSALLSSRDRSGAFPDLTDENLRRSIGQHEAATLAEQVRLIRKAYLDFFFGFDATGDTDGFRFEDSDSLTRNGFG